MIQGESEQENQVRGSYVYGEQGGIGEAGVERT